MSAVMKYQVQQKHVTSRGGVSCTVKHGSPLVNSIRKNLDAAFPLPTKAGPGVSMSPQHQWVFRKQTRSTKFLSGSRWHRHDLFVLCRGQKVAQALSNPIYLYIMRSLETWKLPFWGLGIFFLSDLKIMGNYSKISWQLNGILLNWKVFIVGSLGINS